MIQVKSDPSGKSINRTLDHHQQNLCRKTINYMLLDSGAPENTPCHGSTGGSIDQHTRVHHALLTQYLAGAGEGLAKQGRYLVVVA